MAGLIRCLAGGPGCPGHSDQREVCLPAGDSTYTLQSAALALGEERELCAVRLRYARQRVALAYRFAQQADLKAWTARLEHLRELGAQIGVP